MPHIYKTALVPYTTEQMFQLASDIESYPDFLPWCKETKVLSQTGENVTASITMGGAGLEKSFTTTNVLKFAQSIEMRLIDGPFSHLYGIWKFQPLGDAGCKVSLDVKFEITNKLLRLSLGPVFTKIMNSLVDAFVTRANQIYGN